MPHDIRGKKPAIEYYKGALSPRDQKIKSTLDIAGDTVKGLPVAADKIARAGVSTGILGGVSGATSFAKPAVKTIKAGFQLGSGLTKGLGSKIGSIGKDIVKKARRTSDGYMIDYKR